MISFEDIDAVIDWLEPLGYDAFWSAVEGHDIFGPDDRSHCDHVVAEGIASYQTVLTSLKTTARIALVERHDLNYRSTLPKRTDLRVIH